jgi:flagellum-specific peptidoglycan hydrolase FlgJ
MKKSGKYLFLVLTIITCIMLSIPSYADESTNEMIQLIVDGNNITALSEPVIEHDRVLVPIRFVSEEIGAEVYWDDGKRSVIVEKDDKSMILWIGSHLVEYDNGEIYNLSDVAPKIINERTYVPLRLISNALSIGIEWDEATRSVFVDSNKNSSIESFYDVKMTSIKAEDVIWGKTNIKVSISSDYNGKAKEMKLLLLNKETAKGFVVARETELKQEIVYLPKTEDKGDKVLVFALYDENRQFIGGDAIGINIDVKPSVILTGVTNEVTKGSITLGQNLNFLARYVNYELANLKTGKVININERDPQGTYTWTPSMEQNGPYSIRVVAYDGNGIAFASESLNTTFASERKLSLSGISDGKTVNKPVTLIAARNFDVTETEYVIRDRESGVETIIATIPYGGYKWFPDSEYSGSKELYVRVKDVRGVVHTSAPKYVTVDGSPKVLIHGIGPNQVLTGEAQLSVSSNVNLDSVSYILTHTQTGEKRYVASELNIDQEYNFKPLQNDSGNVAIQAEALYQGKKLLSEKVSFRIYQGKLYGPKAVIQKDEFQEYASNLATDSLNKTGMSAALQTAQAILETAWGQRLPVDKYSGKFSYNLFGIKGSATNGSVISNTWEVYNGKSFRVDAKFRAYNNVNESWTDHKRILLELSRYEPYREVMYDSTLGAWAIRRAGYATDPKYPMKLMNIIKKYNLEELDEIGIE